MYPMFLIILDVIWLAVLIMLTVIPPHSPDVDMTLALCVCIVAAILCRDYTRHRGTSNV